MAPALRSRRIVFPDEVFFTDRIKKEAEKAKEKEKIYKNIFISNLFRVIMVCGIWYMV